MTAITTKIKKLGLLMLVLLTSVGVCSCNERAYGNADPFSAFSGEIRADVRLSLGESSSRYIYRRENGTETVSFSEPEELSGYVFTKKDGKVTLSYGDLTAEVSPSVGRIAFISGALFSPDRDGISSVASSERDGVYITEVICNGTVYRFLHDGTPISAEGTILGTAFSAEILSLG